MKYSLCPLCESTNISEKKDFNSINLLSCEDCGLVFSEKIPSEKELCEFYDSDKETRANYFSPITKLRYEELLNQFEVFRSSGNLLEVGAGNGYFLEIAQEKKWNIHGTEVSENCIDKCIKKEIQLDKGQLSELKYPDNHFDVIVAIELIEHLIDPKKFVQECYRILRPGGLMYVTTPNFNSILRYKLKDQYDVISYPNHLMYFTQKTLTKLFEDQQFATKKIKTTGYSFTRQKTSLGKSKQDFIAETSDDEMLRRRIEENLFLQIGKNTTNSILNFLKIGDSLKGWFVK